MNIGFLFVIIMGGFLLSYMVGINYVKTLRKGNEVSNLTLIIVGIFAGGPAMLLLYIFPEVRDEDSLHHKRFLLCAILFTIIEIVAVILLFSFNLITY